MSAAGRPLAAAVVTRALGVCRRHALALAALALLAGGLPIVAFLAATWALWALRWEPFERGLAYAALAAVALWGALTLVQVGAATSGALRAMRGDRFGLRGAIAAGLRRAPVVALASGLTAAAVLAGAAVLVVPGAAALSSLCLAVPAAVGEIAGPVRAMVRSLDLTRGERPSVFAAVAGIAAAAAVAALVPALLLASAGFGFALGAVLWLSLLAPVPAIAAAAAYAELRGRREAPPASDLERVFE